jgi:hypothetical protein
MRVFISYRNAYLMCIKMVKFFVLAAVYWLYEFFILAYLNGGQKSHQSHETSLER